MVDKSVEQHVIELENQFWQAIKERDADAAMHPIDEPCLLTGAQGVARIDRQALVGLMRAAPYALHDVRLNDVQVRLLRDDVAIVAYQVHEELTVDGKPVTVDAADASVWVRRENRWVCALHTESLAGDPFGRDRIVAE